MIKLYYTFSPVKSDEFIRQVLYKFSGKTDFNIKRTENGKPYVDEDVFFSLSHSGEITVCAVSDENVGADAEKVRSIKNKEKILRKFMSEDCVLSDEDFFKKWTSFESRVKFFGEKITACSSARSEKLFVQTINIAEYIVSVCSPAENYIEKELL